MSTLPQSELPAGAGNALLRILITGLDESILEKYASPDATSAQEKKEKGLPYPVSSHTAAPCDDARPTRVSRSRQRLHFGVVGAPNSLGCWGRGMPLTLHRDASRSTSDTSAFIGRVTISAKERELYLTALEDGTAEMECRLVIVVVEDDIDTEVVFNSGIRIVAVENAETFPARLSAARFEESTTYEMSLQEAALPAVNLQELSQVTEVWRAEWKVNRPTRFTAVKEQFPFLHTISPFSPSALKQRYMDYNDMRSGEEMAKAEGHTGPMVSLSLYTNDPRHSYHQEEWFLGLPPSTQQAMLKQAEQQGFPTTNLFEVTKVAPTPMEGYCWCGAHLPVAAPLKKRQEEIKSKNRNKEGPGSVGRISCSMGKTTTSVSTHTTMGGGGDSSTRGWCVRPLQAVLPVKKFSPDDSLSTQKCWNSILNLAHLEDHAIGITVEAPVAHRQGPLTWLTGRTVITPDMLQSNTKGTIQLPILCTGEEKKSWWVVLHVQYMIVYPYNHDHNDLRVLRSEQSYNRLSIPSLVGHRGLGKTYTRSREKGQTAKLAENSIESFTAAHRRGCEMVEFDVMLTWDRVPIIIHDPILRLQARQKPLAERNEALPFTPSAKELELRSKQPGLYRGLQRIIADHHSQYAPVPVSVHTLTKNQLDGIVTESCELSGASSRLKLLIMRYWPYILRIYRNRQRILCMAEDGLCAREESTLDEFEGCREVPTTPLTLDNNDVNLLMPYIDSYRIQDARNNRFLRRQVDITNKIPTLMELFEQVPSSLRMDIEVKYPFQPKWDASLFLQTDAFEINGFVDSVLDVVFAFAPENREIAFSSFEPDVCIALALKQSRYDVLFLSDTEEQSDLKDYRSFYVSGAIQFASLQHLSGVSIAADTLTAKDQKHIPSTPIPPDVQSAYARRLKKIMQTQKPGEEEEGTSSIPTFDELLTVVQMEFEKRKKLFDATVHDNEAAVQFEKMWASFNAEYGRSIVKDAHRRGLKVWTWGGANSNHRYSCVQAGTMKVDGIITDDIPVVDTNEGDDRV